MRRMLMLSFVLILFVSLYVSSASAGGLADALAAIERNRNNSEKNGLVETPLITPFVEYGVQISQVSFKHMDSALPSIGCFVERITPTKKDFGQHRILDDSGFELIMLYMPIDSSYDSNDFGDLEKEMLYCVQLSYGEKAITISNSMHTQEVGFTTYDKNRSIPNQKVHTIENLLSFFSNEMGGFVPESLKNVKTEVSESKSIEYTIERRSKEYTGCTIKSIQINVASGYKTISHIVSVYVEYGRNTGLSTTKSLIDTYSDDLAVYIAKMHESVVEVHVFWTIPKQYGDTIAAKCSYTVLNRKAYIDGKSGLLYRNTK